MVDAHESQIDPPRGQLTGDLSRTASEIDHASSTRKMRLNEIGESSDRRRAGVGGREGIVRVAAIELLVERFIACGRPLPPRPVQMARKPPEERHPVLRNFFDFDDLDHYRR